VSASTSKSKGPVMELRHFPSSSIVKIKGRWGMLCVNRGYNLKNHKMLVVDFWDGGREEIPKVTKAEGLPIEE
jgi:hypothetical protein